MRKPFEDLGGQLKAIRQKQHESLAEVSGAIEINVDDLERIELGEDRPSEDLLMLLVSHFEIDDEEALGLWQLAGYYDQSSFEKTYGNDLNRSIVVMMALDSRIIYSDDAQINVNKKGIVVSFLQNGGANNSQVPIARIGMSYEQTRSLLKNLHHSLLYASATTTPKRITAEKISKKKSSPSKKR